MSLTNCPECNKQLSKKAPTCPHCGHPIKPVVIEQTKKGWKIVKLISALVIIAGIFMIINGSSNSGLDNPLTASGISATFLGIITLIIAKFGTWWSNK